MWPRSELLIHFSHLKGEKKGEKKERENRQFSTFQLIKLSIFEKVFIPCPGPNQTIQHVSINKTFNIRKGLSSVFRASFQVSSGDFRHAFGVVLIWIGTVTLLVRFIDSTHLHQTYRDMSTAPHTKMHENYNGEHQGSEVTSSNF